MMENSLFIRGLLDPSENELISTSNKFADEFRDLLKKADNTTEKTMTSITNDTLTTCWSCIKRSKSLYTTIKGV